MEIWRQGGGPESSGLMEGLRKMCFFWGGGLILKSIDVEITFEIHFPYEIHAKYQNSPWKYQNPS